MRHLWQWICGYIQVTLRGRQVNRFLNLCSRNGIFLWKISYDLEHVVRVHMRLKDFYSLKPYLRKTKTCLRITRKCGFPFWCYRHPVLKWMLVVAVCVIALSFYSLTYIWEIQIRGNSEIATYELEEYLKSQNITVGIRRNGVDCTGLEYRLREAFGEMGWVSVYFEHTRLCIEIRESLYGEFVPEPSNDGTAYHLVANKDALVTSIVTQSGKPVVKAGTNVKTGDILVLGQCEIYDDAGEVKEILNVRAKALVYGEVDYTFLGQINEMEIFALKLSETYQEQILYNIADLKFRRFVENLEQNGVIILNKNVMIDKKEKNIVFLGNAKAREQIGINIPDVR